LYSGELEEMEFLGVPPAEKAGVGLSAVSRLLDYHQGVGMPLLSLTRGFLLKTRHKDIRKGLLGERKCEHAGYEALIRKGMRITSSERVWENHFNPRITT